MLSLQQSIMSKADIHRKGFWRKCYNLGDYIFVNKALITTTLFECSNDKQKEQTIYVSLYYDHLIQFVVRNTSDLISQDESYEEAKYHVPTSSCFFQEFENEEKPDCLGIKMEEGPYAATFYVANKESRKS